MAGSGATTADLINSLLGKSQGANNGIRLMPGVPGMANKGMELLPNAQPGQTGDIINMLAHGSPSASAGLNPMLAGLQGTPAANPFAALIANGGPSASPGSVGTDPLLAGLQSTPAANSLSAFLHGGMANNPLGIVGNLVGQVGSALGGGAGAGAAGGGAVPFNPLGAAAARRLAEKQLGGFDSSAFDAAMAAAQQQAGTQSHQARQLGRRSMADDATLYGRLGNFIDSISQAGRQETHKTEQDLSQNFSNLQHGLKNTYRGQDAASNAEMGRLGIDPTTATGGTQADEAFFRSRAAAEKSDAKGNARDTGDAFGKLMGMTHGDVVATGTGKVADARSTMNDTLENIASALSQQLAGLHGQESTAQNSYQSQLRSAASQLMQQSASQDPNSIDNQLKLAQIAKEYASAAGTSGTAAKAGDPWSGKSGYSNAAAYLQAMGQQGPAAGGVDPNSVGTILNILNQTMQGSPNGLPTQFESQNLGTILTRADAAGAKVKMTAPQTQALNNAILMILGKY